MTTENLLTDLNEAQAKAVTHTGGPLLVIAGAGTGKTTVITKRLAWLICDQGIPSQEILALTFTEKAAGEMLERVDRLLPYGYLDLWIHTFHAFCERILRAHAIDVGLSDDFRLVTPLDAWRLVRTHLDRFELDYYQPLGNPTKFIHSLIRHFSRGKDELVTPEDYLRYSESLRLNTDVTTAGDVAQETRRNEEVARAYHTYQQILLENSALDFGDLIVQTLRLFRERPAILECYRAHFKSILVDEFQDTNWAQYELVKLLAAPRNALTVVGDDDQAVYKFRGASVANILQFQVDFPDATRVVLADNYRSRQEILDTAYQFIQQNNPHRLEVSLEGTPFTKKLQAARGTGGSVTLQHAIDAASEVKGIIDWLIHEHKNGAAWSDFAILLRANSQADIFVSNFEVRGLPYEYLASSGLFRKSVVLDILAWLRLLDNYHESRALWRILSIEFLHLPPEDVMALSNHAHRKSWSLYEAMRQHQTVTLASATHTTLAHILSVLSRHAESAKRNSVQKSVLAFLHEFGTTDISYLKWVTASLQVVNTEAGDTQRQSIQNVSYIRQFLKRLEHFEATSIDTSTRAFLEEIDAARAAGEEGSLRHEFEDVGPDAIHILTVHGAKGLEFPYVIIPQLIDLRFPSTERADAIELPVELVKERLPEGDWHLEEERRLFYVALTRARERVLLTHADDYGGARKRRPSRFLVELGLTSKISTSRHLDISKPNGDTPVVRGDMSIKKTSLLNIYSFTQLRAFETCPLQYKFAHILRLPVPPRAPLQYGKALHATLQKYLSLFLDQKSKVQGDLFTSPDISKSQNIEISKYPSLETLMRLYEESWNPDWFENSDQRDRYKQQGRQALEWFWAQLQENTPQPLGLEQGFTIRLGTSSIKGRIDRVDTVPDGVEIIDYKTGKVPASLDASAKRQLLLYQIAARDPHILGKVPQKLTYIYLDAQTSVSFVGSEADEEKVKAWATELIQRIESGEAGAHPGMWCKTCDFRDICEFAL